MTTGLLLFFATMAGWREQATAFQPVPPPTSPTRLMLSSSTVQVVDNATPSSSITLSELSDRQTTQSEFIDRWVQSQDNDDDVFWSIFSNAFFVGGGLFYMIGSGWDLSLSNSGMYPQSMFFYHSIWIFGPLVYLLNSFIDVAWAIRTRKTDKSRRCLRRFYMTAHEHAADVGNEGDSGQDVQLALEKFDRHVAAGLGGQNLVEGAITYGKQRSSITSEGAQNVLLRRIRRHFGHRRELSAATTFGFAAVFGLWSAVGDAAGNMDESLVYRLDMISIHVYLLSAVFALVGPRRLQQESGSDEFNLLQPFSFLEDTQALENLGDAFFGIASIIDVLLCDLSFDDENPWWPVVSASLWLLDALLYLRGDFVALYRKSQRDINRQVSIILEEFEMDGLSPETNFVLADSTGID